MRRNNTSLTLRYVLSRVASTSLSLSPWGNSLPTNFPVPKSRRSVAALAWDSSCSLHQKWNRISYSTLQPTNHIQMDPSIPRLKPPLSDWLPSNLRIRVPRGLTPRKVFSLGCLVGFCSIITGLLAAMFFWPGQTYLILSFEGIIINNSFLTSKFNPPSIPPSTEFLKNWFIQNLHLLTSNSSPP